jgi:hypothetical protein
MYTLYLCMMLLCSSKLDGLHNGLGRLLLEQSNLSWILFLAVWVFDACSHTKTAWSNTSTEAGPSWAYSGLLLSALQEFFIYPFPLPRSPLVLACVRGSVHPFLPCSEDWPSGAALRQVFVGPFAGYEYRQGTPAPSNPFPAVRNRAPEPKPQCKLFVFGSDPVTRPHMYRAY